MKSHHLINLSSTTYDLLEELAQEDNRTINEVIVDLLHQNNQAVDLTTSLDTVPSMLVQNSDSLLTEFDQD
jgi:predicted DNA-binding ribbon-helix-helix protein